MDEPNRIASDEEICSYVFTFRELLLLLQGAGAEQIDGIYMEEPQATEEEIIFLIDGLVKKGVLEADGDVFRMEETVGRMIRCMIRPQYHYRARENGADVYCYERGRDLLVTRIPPVRKRTIGMVLRRKGDLLV